MPPEIEEYLTAAMNHGDNSEDDQEIGDLQEMLRVAWEIMTPQQRDQFRNDPCPLGILTEWSNE
jgi:hypothetical protein